VRSFKLAQDQRPQRDRATHNRIKLEMRGKA